MYFNIEKVNVGLNAKILLMADIHFSLKYKDKRLDKIVKRVSDIKPDYIVIAGDTIDVAEVGRSDRVDVLVNFFKSLSEISPVLFVLGNHDNSSRLLNKKMMPQKWLNKLKSIDNVYLLNKKGLTFNNITFYGYEAPYDYFQGKENDLDLLNKTFDIRTGDNYNILVTHSPINLTTKSVFDDLGLNRFNLILCGHMHNGLMPHFLPGHMGVVSPSKGLLPYDVRGVINVDNTKFIITGGVVKLSNTAGFLTHLNWLYPISLTLIY